MRCQNCRRIAVADIRDCEILQQPSFAALKKSAEAGCDLCNLSYAAISSSCSGVKISHDGNNVELLDMLCRGQNPTREDRSDTRVYLEGELNDYYECNHFKEKVEKVSVRVGGYLFGQNSIEAFLKVGVDSDSMISKYITGRLPSQQPGEPTTMSRIKGWIENCDQTHKGCNFSSVERPQPKRILDISGDRIFVLHTDFAEGRYVALSYCWGASGRNVLLTNATLHEFTMIGIDANILPQTVQDAIVICKALGIHRLWVDALCIIQREPDYKDFIAEAPRMSEYYRNAYLTLIAGSARDCADGFLHKRKNHKSLPCQLFYDRKTCSSDPDMTGSVTLFMTPSQDHGPIKDRAWTFQELKLSQRSLIYGPEQMQLICPSMSILEDGEFQMIYSPTERLPFNPKGYPNIHHLARHDKEPKVVDRAYQVWFETIYGYTIRKMSDKQDKLAAIAGLASLLQKIIHCRYMYGLWENALPHGLLWKTQKPWRSANGTGSVTRVVHRAPSWSWASIDGPILHHFSTHTHRDRFKDPTFFHLKILAFDNVPSSFDPVREGHDIPQAFEMTVRGLLRGACYTPSPSGDPSEFLLSESRNPSAIEGSKGHRNGAFGSHLVSEHVATATWDTYEDFEQKTYCDHQLYALLLTSNLGLLLVHVEKERYRRIGRFWKPRQDLFKNTNPQDVTLI